MKSNLPCLLVCKCFMALQIFLAATNLNAQSKLNFGLTRTLEDSLLPKSKAPLPYVVKKKKVNSPISFERNDQHRYLLNNGWEMADEQTVMSQQLNVLSEAYNSKDWYNAVVPGTVLTTLVEQGVYPDPYFGLNNMYIPDTLCRQNWWYRLSFPTPESTDNHLVWLHFEGVNYKAIYYLNGVLLGQSAGAFVRTKFDITNLLKKTTKNILTVKIIPPPNPGIPHEQSYKSGMGPNGGQLAMDGPTFISSEGWDWVPGIRDRNIGIWQPVYLQYTGVVTLEDPQIVTDLPLPDTSQANLTIKLNVKNNSNFSKRIQLSATFDTSVIYSEVLLAPNELKTVLLDPKAFPTLHVKQPKLWWPNGYGHQYMYNLKLIARIENEISDVENVRFGIREYSYELMADAPHKKAWRFTYSPTNLLTNLPIFDNVNRREFANKIFIPSIKNEADISTFEALQDTTNPYLVIRVNGIRIFCKGGNWGMDDGMKRVSRAKLEPYFRLHKEANYNMIRNWTGESTEEIFYALADEYGMMVWNDFWLSTEGYNLNVINQPLFLSNSLDVIKRFRNHPSIAIWCPRNEGYAPMGIENELTHQLMVEDNTRHYIGNSREINLRQSGDWHFIENPDLYFTKYAEGFSTEIGTFSIPTASTIKKFMHPNDWWPINDVWHYHDLHSNNQNLQGYLKTIDSLYGPSNSLDEFTKKVQWLNYETHRTIFEAWNSKLWKNASGVLLWMSHPAWPSMIWQTYTYDYETNGSYFGAKKACEPLHIQLNLNDGNCVLVNTSLQTHENVSFKYEVYDMNGLEVAKFNHIANSPANSIVNFSAKQQSVNQYPAIHLIRLSLMDQSGQLLSVNDYIKNNPQTKNFRTLQQMNHAEISSMITKIDSSTWRIKVKNNGATVAVGIKLNLTDKDNVILLPAYFSDGYFNLLPKEEKEITVEYHGLQTPNKVRVDAYNDSVKYVTLQQ
jgi:hypothetical protein